MYSAVMDWSLVPKGSWCYRQSNLPLQSLTEVPLWDSILFLGKFNIIWFFYRFGIDYCFFSRVPDEAVGLHLEAMFYWKDVSLNTRVTLGAMRWSCYRRHLETESDGENSSFRTPTLCSLLCVCGKNWKMNMHKVNLLIIWLQSREQRRDPVEGEDGGIIQGKGGVSWGRGYGGIEEETGQEAALQAGLDLDQSTLLLQSVSILTVTPPSST